MRRLLLSLLTLGLLGLTAPAVEAASSHAQRDDRIIMGLSTKTIRPGGTVTVRGGVVEYIRDSTTVTLQKRFATGGWVNAGSHTIRGDGSFSFAEKPTTTKNRHYRVCVSGVCSAPVKLTIRKS